jgi:hypothetical protein
MFTIDENRVSDAVHHQLCGSGLPLPPSTTNNYCWLLMVLVIDCVAVVMVVVDGGNSGRY